MRLIDSCINLRLKDLLGPVTRVKKKESDPSEPETPISAQISSYNMHTVHTVEYDPFIKSQLAPQIDARVLCGANLVT